MSKAREFIDFWVGNSVHPVANAVISVRGFILTKCVEYSLAHCRTPQSSRDGGPMLRLRHALVLRCRYCARGGDTEMQLSEMGLGCVQTDRRHAAVVANHCRRLMFSRRIAQ
jgi:hypothetical protein